MNGMSEIPPMAFRVFAIIQMYRGGRDQASKAVQHLLELGSEYSLQDVLHNYGETYIVGSDLQRVFKKLRAAGLPE